MPTEPKLDEEGAALPPGTSLAASLASSEPGRPAGNDEDARYASIGVLGEGAFGRVYRVLDRDLKREVAVKLLKPRPGREKEDLLRFLEEAQATAQLEHPNIVPIHEIGTHADGLYYTMKLLAGRTLAEVFEGLRGQDQEAIREWSLTRLVQVFLQVCQALRFAHAKGVIHRDLKPHNVMLGDYGEVIVMDWGLAKVAAGGEVRTEGFVSTVEGAILGSPAYMSPEQAAGEVSRVDARSDVWSLGVILYEMLTLTRPFASKNAAWLLARILMEDPEPPRKRAPDREIPLELERACLRALAKDPARRHASARELCDEVQAWLESEHERGRRRELANVKAQAGLRDLAGYRRLQQEVLRLDKEHQAIQGRYRSWQPLAEKQPLLEKAQELETTRHLLDRAFADAVAQLTTAVGLEPENRIARGALAELYWEKFTVAEQSQDERDLAYFRPLVELYHDGRYSHELKGDGVLELDSNPSGAEVWLYRYQEESLQLVPRGEKLLGRTPLGPLPLSMGSYLLILRTEGALDVRYPVLISRNRNWRGSVNLYSETEIGGPFRYVPAGPFIQGGDEVVMTWSLTRNEAWVEDFFIAEHPVTVAEYLEFLNDLARTRPDEALTRSPRRHPEGGSYLLQGGDGLFSLPELDAEGDSWDLRWPVVGVSFYDALAYCEWRSRRDGCEIRLPTDPEWEKAARGVDGRWFPWGNRYDASLCNHKESRRERPAPVTVDGFATDVSPYLVRGTAGNVRDWTGKPSDAGEGTTARAYFIIRGGCWGFAPTGRNTPRFGVSPTLVDGQLGFRVVRTPGR